MPGGAFLLNGHVYEGAHKNCNSNLADRDESGNSRMVRMIGRMGAVVAF